MEISIIESVISMFILLLVGVYGSRRRIISEEMNKGLINILIQIILPFLILSSFIHTYDNSIKDNIIKTYYYSFTAYLVTTGLSYALLLPIKNNKKTILHFANVFTNTGYVGFPVLHSIYGWEGVLYGSIFNMFFVILVWTYGIMLFKNKIKWNEIQEEVKKILFNPSITAVVMGIFIMTFNIELPNALLISIKSIGNITGPISMIIIGGIISRVRIKKHLKDWTLYYGIIIKLIIIPLSIFLLSTIFVETSTPLYSVIIMTAMPASTMTAILAENFDQEKEFAAVIVSFTTLFSLITINLIVAFII